MSYINFVIRDVRITLLQIVIIQSILAINYFYYYKDIENILEQKYPLQYKKIIKAIHIFLSFNALICTILGMIVLV